MARPERTLYVGTCHGGPLDGVTMTSRFPAGVLAVDRPAGRCWIYDYRDGAFYVREPEGREVDHGRRIAAADGPAFDVVAVP